MHGEAGFVVASHGSQRRMLADDVSSRRYFCRQDGRAREARRTRREEKCSAAVPAIPVISEISREGVRIRYYGESIGANGAASSRLVPGKKEDTRDAKAVGLDWIKGVYLPAGYPLSVTEDYLAFTKWRTLQNLASSIMAVLSTEALLFGLGLGRTTKAVAAAANWVLKDGLGYIGKVIYGYVAGKRFDHDPKSWRISSDLLEDIGGFLELLTPLAPGQFLLIASFANMLKSISAMTGTATRHAIYKSLALRENQGDIATKGESQGVTCKLLGLAIGIAISHYIGQQYFKLLALYTCFGIVHMTANWQSMSCVQFSTLNRQRADMVMSCYLRQEPLEAPLEISHEEQIILPPWKEFRHNIVLGATVSAAFGSSLKDVTIALSVAKTDKFLINVRHGKLYVVFHTSAKSDDYLQAWLACLRFQRDREQKLEHPILLPDAIDYARANIAEFLRQARSASWNVDYSLLNPSVARAQW